MTGLRRALWALAVAGVLLGLAVLALVLSSDMHEHPRRLGGRRPADRLGLHRRRAVRLGAAARQPRRGC